MKSITAVSNAKINLSLDVLGSRSDGYHEVRMIMQSIPLSDEITVEISDGEGIEILCAHEGVPEDGRNIAYKAASLFLERTGNLAHIKITIDKTIPVAAGMAGGSTNAAAVLKSLNTLFDSPLSEKELLALGLKVGADVPFCLMGGCAISEGIGEILTPIKPLSGAFIVVAKPDFSVSTKWVYSNFIPERIEKHPDTEKVRDAIAKGNIYEIAKYTANVLESVTESKYPVIAEYKKIMSENGAILSMMSGSGPSVFGIFDDKAKAQKTYSLMKDINNETFIIEI